jgi:hypothetical protein
MLSLELNICENAAQITGSCRMWKNEKTASRTDGFSKKAFRIYIIFIITEN